MDFDRRQDTVADPGRSRSLKAEEIRVNRLLDDFADATRTGDLERIMSFYSDDVVAFDVPAPLRLTGRREFRKNWEKWYTTQFRFPVLHEIHDRELFVCGDVAFAFELFHVNGVFKEAGRAEESWVRHTVGLRKLDVGWRIVHEHCSVPVAEDGKAMMNLKPHDQLTH